MVFKRTPKNVDKLCCVVQGILDRDELFDYHKKNLKKLGFEV